MPKVSFVMPVYNLGAFLAEAVASALAQTFTDFELIIVDDGSDDPATRALLATLGQPRTTVLRAAHHGVVAARNLGIAHARGEYLSFLDADDRLDPRFLARTVAALDADPQLTFVSVWVRLFGDESADWRAERCDLVTLLADCSVAPPALVRRNAVVELGGFDPAMESGHEDWDLWLSLVERGHRGAILPETLFFHRRRPGSRSTVADHGGTYLELHRARIHKHQDSYRAHLLDVLATQEQAIGHHLRALAGAHESLAAHQQARDHAQAALHERQRELATVLEALLARAHGELVALRGSRSWRVTAPLRRALAWVDRWARP